ncbi:MAG: hypothetical protein M0011_00090 [Elusimicrobia bacterium]|nr:hypothetical protein [Elusimicrobiota bacterium]
MSTVFSDTLQELRKASGFSTAYRFFHDNGGQAALGFTYRQYMLMESGVLPEAGKLGRLIPALRLIPLTPPANRLVTAWLRTRAGEAVYDQLVAPILPAKTKDAQQAPMHGLVRAMMRERVYYLTHEQFEASLADYPTYICYTAITADTGLWTAASLAEALDLKKGEVEAALKRLASVGIAKKVKQGVYRCPFSDRMIQCPQLNTVSPELLKKVNEYITRLAASAETRLREGFFVRADRHQFMGHFPPLLRFAIEASYGYTVREKSPSTAIFYAEGRIVQVRDF